MVVAYAGRVNRGAKGPSCAGRGLLSSHIVEWRRAGDAAQLTQSGLSPAEKVSGVRLAEPAAFVVGDQPM